MPLQNVTRAAAAVAEGEQLIEDQSQQLLGNEAIWLRAIGHKVREDATGADRRGLEPLRSYGVRAYWE